MSIEVKSESGSIGLQNMKNAIIVHGSTNRDEYYATKHPSMSNSHWIPWLQKQLLVANVPAATPEVPHCFVVDYEAWRREFERFEITPETLLVGHSCGAGFLVRWLSEHPDIRVGRVVLVAPWMNPFKEKEGDMFEGFEIDPAFMSRTQGVTIFNSDDDMDSVLVSVAKLRDVVPGIGYREFHGYRHFDIKRMGTDAFPELLEFVLA